MKKTTLLFALLFSVLSFAQIKFEKAYFIDNAGTRTDCLIRNIVWKNNPTSFEYKSDENSEVKIGDIKNVKSFGILDQVKYVRGDVQIDRSSSDLYNLTYSREPVFVKEQLFLRELVDGTANLYKYENGALTRYFYQMQDGSIEQLIYKPYNLQDSKVSYNRDYLEQLKKDLSCSGTDSQIDRLEYKEKQLVNFFTDYNKCVNPSYEQTILKTKKGNFNLNIRPRVNFASFTVSNDTFLTADMDDKTTFSAGLEAEYVFPFNKNKWSIIIEPTYQHYKSQNIQDVNFLVGGKAITNVDFESITIPIGIRHYMYLNQKSKIFINAQYVVDVALKTSIEIIRQDGSSFKSVDITPNSGFAAGIGYNYNDKFGMEIRQSFNSNEYGGWKTKYNYTSLIFSYRIF